MKSFYFKLLSLALISCLGIIVYSNTFHCSFHLDDRSSIFENLSIRNLRCIQTIWNFLPRRFILYLSIALNYHLNGLNVVGYHIFNLMIHLTTSILVWWLALLTLSTPAIKGFPLEKNTQGKKKSPQNDTITKHSDLIALFVGLVFVSHPIQTQAVTYIVQRAASMATLFYLASLCFYVKSRLLSVGAELVSARSMGGNIKQNLRQAKNRESDPPLRIIFYICSLVTALIAMFTKETAITLPLMILLYEFFFLTPKKNLPWLYLSPFLLSIFIIPITISLTESPEAQHLRGVVPDGPAGISSTDYLLTQFKVIVTYLRLAFLPLNQNLDYDYPISHSLFELPTFISLLFLALIFFVAYRLFSKYRMVSFSILWFFLTLLPESSFLPIRDVIFEHRLYLPLVGFSLFIVTGVYYGTSFFFRHSEQSEESKGALRSFPAFRMTMVVLIMIIACNSFLTYQRNKVWKDELTLWADCIKKSPHKARTYYSRGKAFDVLGKYTQAMADYNKTIELKPDYVDAYNNRGVIYYAQSNLSQAESDFSKAIEIDPTDTIAYNDRGNLYDKQGHLTQALSDYNKALEIRPDYAEAYANRGNIYDKRGNFVQAMSDYNKAVELNPDLAKAYNNRGSSLDKQGKINEAIADFNTAIEKDPLNATAFSDRGSSYALEGDLFKAISDFNKAIEIAPGYAEAFYNRGLIFDRQNNFSQAISDFTKAIEINPQYAQAYTDRGRVYQKNGHLALAMSDYSNALAIDPRYATAYNNRAVDYYQLKDFNHAWQDMHKAKELGYPVNADFLRQLKQASGQE